eukprot:1403169-Pyramimonas_sp.AAC.1
MRGAKARTTFEKEPPLIREARPNVSNECERRGGESHMLKKSRLQSVKFVRLFKMSVRGAKAITTV